MDEQFVTESNERVAADRLPPKKTKAKTKKAVAASTHTANSGQAPVADMSGSPYNCGNDSIMSSVEENVNPVRSI